MSLFLPSRFERRGKHRLLIPSDSSDTDINLAVKEKAAEKEEWRGLCTCVVSHVLKCWNKRTKLQREWNASSGCAECDGE